jgi:para-nitrobenzyl esterase
MLKFRIAAHVGLLLLTLVGRAQNPAQVVRVQSGVLRGALEDGMRSFRGIPFASAPVGSLRWKPPKPAASWSGVREATRFASDCMQLPFEWLVPRAAPAGVSEDCLYLNVLAPPRSAGKKLPVMVYIHGGSLVNGGSSAAITDGSNFGAHGVVFVSFNYRLGRFGFFAFPALSHEGSGGLLNNYGYMDQIAALRWVQRNIHAFGGDPRNVTVVGDSAGGTSALVLLTSPVTKGLFERVIVQSGCARDGLTGVRYLDRASATDSVSAEETGVAFARKAGITGTDAAALAALRSLPAEKLIDGLNTNTFMESRGSWSGPIIDGVIQKDSLEVSLLSGHVRKIPILIGANSADVNYPPWHTAEEFLAVLGPDGRRAAVLYDAAHSSNLRLLALRVIGDLMMAEPARFVARAMAAAGAPAYEYRFSYVAASNRRLYPGALHGSQIPYIFSTLKAAGENGRNPEDQAVADQVAGYWINFIKTGNPNGTGLPTWPAYRAATDRIMNFTNNGPVDERDTWKERLDLMEKVATRADSATRQSAPADRADALSPHSPSLPIVSANE